MFALSAPNKEALADDFARARFNMVEGQLRAGGVRHDALLSAMGSIPREDFVAAESRGVAYRDTEVPATHGRRLLAPLVFARLLEAANIKSTDRVLDVGAASGYSSAVLSRLAGEVYALENDPSLVRAIETYRTANMIGKLHTVQGNLTDGYNVASPYHVIIIEGGAQWVPDALLAQLAAGGRLICVTCRPDAWAGEMGRACLFEKKANGSISSRDLFDAYASLLSGFTLRPGFEF